jgi:hypothetical protein
MAAHVNFESWGMLRGKVLTDTCACTGTPSMLFSTYTYEAELNHNIDNPGNAATHNTNTGVPSDNVSNGGRDDNNDNNNNNDAQGDVSHVFLPSKHGIFSFSSSYFVV